LPIWLQSSLSVQMSKEEVQQPTAEEAAQNKMLASLSLPLEYFETSPL
jgi:hypothetical protein